MANSPIKYANEHTIRSDHSPDHQLPVLIIPVFSSRGFLSVYKNIHEYIFAHPEKWEDIVYTVLCIAFFKPKNNSEMITFWHII